MDKEQLNNRIQLIKNDMEAAKSTYIKLEGHLQETMHWLQEIEKKEEPVKNDGLTETIDC